MRLATCLLLVVGLVGYAGAHISEDIPLKGTK